MILGAIKHKIATLQTDHTKDPPPNSVVQGSPPLVVRCIHVRIQRQYPVHCLIQSGSHGDPQRRAAATPPRVSVLMYVVDADVMARDEVREDGGVREGGRQQQGHLRVLGGTEPGHLRREEPLRVSAVTEVSR